jgi:hypothetical protein
MMTAMTLVLAGLALRLPRGVTGLFPRVIYRYQKRFGQAGCRLQNSVYGVYGVQHGQYGEV